MPLEITSGTKLTRGQKIVIYGPGGIGKSELCSLLPKVGKSVLFVDADEGTGFLDVQRTCPTRFESIRAALHSRDVLDFDAVVVDSLTKAEEFAATWVIQNVKHEKGYVIESIEDYGFGKGFTHIYEAMLLLLADLDALARRGKTVIGIAHDCVASVPNPRGEDWQRWEPRLMKPQNKQSPNDFRLKVREWSDHVLFIGYDVAVEGGKGKGSGTRCIYPTERPECMAKSRTLADPIPYNQGDAEVWRQIFNV
jgi:hypothetical protein